MLDAPIAAESVLEVVAPDGARRVVRISHFPFLIGRGSETGNHLQLPDRRISRQCAALILQEGQIQIQDRGQRRGVFVNGEKIECRALSDGDLINFGLKDSFELRFRSGPAQDSLPELLTRMDHVTSSDTGPGGLRKLNLLLKATALLHSHLPLDSVLAEMVDQVIALADADRGLLLRPDQSGVMRTRVARQKGGHRLSIEGLEPSKTALRLALEHKSAVVTEDIEHDNFDLKAAQSIIAQQLRSVVVVPLFSLPSKTDTPKPMARGEPLGMLYLDSRRPAAFSRLERQILDALADEAASIIDNARLVELERERERLEQEVGIAREIQQALLPREFHHFPHLQVIGVNQPCYAVGGDYFDVLQLEQDRTAFLIADVSGKGLGAALLTTMLQGALSGMTLGQEPAKVFTHINRFLCDHSNVGRYATLFFGVLERSGRLEYINAGHPSPLLLRNGRAESAFPASSFPVGLIPEAEFSSAEVELEAGDTLVLFSDGITEAMDPEEAQFGANRLKETLDGHVNSPVEELQRVILGAVESFTRGARQADDLTLLLVKYLAAGQTATAHAG
ncbi:MAG TPA: SpoIIE family protein phosphatase [Candidatus Dormibacteraeota bacterium]|nr:SpoIIE family protein phosphatase [Candidatus Dormibacteraeota bacterium]